MAQQVRQREPGEPVHVVGVVDLVATHDPDRAQQATRVGRGEHEHAVVGEEDAHRVEEEPGVVDVLDDLARDHDVGRFEPQVPHRVGTRAVDGVGLVAELASVVDAGRVDVEPHERLGAPRQVLVQPRAGGVLHLREPGVDEADVNDTTPVGDVGEVREPVDDLRRREPVHHPELGRRVAHAGASTEKLADALPERLAPRPRSTRRSFENSPRRLYQSRRLPNRPTSGTSQNGSSGSKSYGWQ